MTALYQDTPHWPEVLFTYGSSLSRTAAGHGSKITLFADDTSIIFTHPNHMEFENEFNNLFSNITRWFQTNSLSLNFNKTHFMDFRTSSTAKNHVNNYFKIKHINKVHTTIFFRSNTGQYYLLEPTHQ